MDHAEYYKELKFQIEQVFANHKNLRDRDHREKYPWYEGAFGDPFAGRWLILENAPRRDLEEHDTHARQRNDREPFPPDLGWRDAPRESVLPGRLRDISWLSRTGWQWHCYVTNVVKSADTETAQQWKRCKRSARQQVARWWAPVLDWELEMSNPRIVVVVGKRIWNEYIKPLVASGDLRPLPPKTWVIYHSAYVDTYRPMLKAEWRKTWDEIKHADESAGGETLFDI